MWGRHAEVAEKYIRKGTQLFIEGQLRTRMWEDRNAIKHYVTEIHVDNFELLGRPKTEAAPQQPVAQQQQVQQQPVAQPQQTVQQQLPTEPPF